MGALPVEGMTTEQIAEELNHLAAEQTLFTVMSTGLSIAAGGALVTTLLGETWPGWLRLLLTVVFLVIGYSLTLFGLRRHAVIVRTAAQRRGGSTRMMSLRLLSVGIGLLEVAIIVVVVLFLIGAFGSDTP